MSDAMLVPRILIVGASIIAAATDVWKFKVYNALTLPLTVSAFFFYGWIEGSEGLLTSFGGFVVAFGLFILPYAMGAVGAGDVKFVAAMGAWLGAPATVQIVLFGCLFAGVYAVGVIAYHKKFRETWFNLQVIWHRFRVLGQYLWANEGDETVQKLATRPDRRSRLVPISAMMAIGLLVYVLWDYLR